ncbi:hypothetical protein [Paenibacillus lutrae]|uniref:Uncharacterized protein n=1 Tax=Paenibacillus lutrae TaxID=2078573 RepID=A0A7X3K1M7_9BACL|nr:hypothetical protein [Paenibacillus lutrae]MVP02408.1 hypothetical protein [Paenibacillus lutrae]
MARGNSMVPFGYEEEQPKRRGTLLVFETFEDWTDHELTIVLELARQRQFNKIVLYPQHEDSLRRMSIACAVPYYKRVKNLEKLVEEAGGKGAGESRITIDTWEGKRKKYTPVDTSLRFLTDKYTSPYFVMMNDHYAVLFAGYKGFEDWIREVRLLVWKRFGVPLPSKLLSYSDRMDFMEENGEEAGGN